MIRGRNINNAINNDREINKVTKDIVCLASRLQCYGRMNSIYPHLAPLSHLSPCTKHCLFVLHFYCLHYLPAPYTISPLGRCGN